MRVDVPVLPEQRTQQFLTELASGLQQQAELLRAGGSENNTVCGDVSIAAPAGEAAKLLREISALRRILEEVAVKTGAAQATVLEALADGVMQLLEVRKQRRVLTAGPRANAVLVSLLPLGAIALSELLGFNALQVFLTPLGLAFLLLGLALTACGFIWQQKLIATTAHLERVAGVECELVAVALAAGSEAKAALRIITDAAFRAAGRWLDPSTLAAGGPVQTALERAIEAGAPVAKALQSQARMARTQVLEEMQVEISKLGSRTLLPMVCCVLPAFLLLGVMPMLVSMLKQLSF